MGEFYAGAVSVAGSRAYIRRFINPTLQKARVEAFIKKRLV